MQNNSEKSAPKGHTRTQWAVAILVNSTVLTYGLQCGWVSPMTKILQSEESPVGRPLTDSELSLIAGIPSLAAVVGILILLYVVETYGRKRAVIIMAFLQLICWIIKLCPSNPISLLVSRIFCGLGAGGCFHVVPMYVKEISQDNIRGTLGSISALFQSLGILSMYAIGGYLGYYTVLYFVTAIAVCIFVMLFQVPESPSFLVNQGKLKESTAAIAYLRGLQIDNKEVQNEMDSIKREDDYYKSIPHITFFGIFKYKAWRRGFLIMFVLVILHGLNGVFSIISYASTVLKNSKMEISPELQSLAIPISLTLGTATTMTIVDRLGRKVLLGITFAVSSLALASLATNQLLSGYDWATPSWLPIVAILVTVYSYGGGVSPLPFIIMTEMFNFRIRAKLMGILSATAWSMTFVQLVSFTAVTNTLGVETSFYIFCGINFIGVILVLFVLPETAGKTVDQIETKLRNDKHDRNSDI
ncbi:unnamed protein product [Arctia plantaginis]|uniref:Major facilitator superfamily (MFS) profile domain-containing protein n=1 Tax=Arctia plantaginis TaxID=874455 RepID=A0A8S0YU28_ARCPL|nr:unnamed protein product [Arctia plantaginis]